MNELNEKFKYQLRTLKDTQAVLLKEIEKRPDNQKAYIQLQDINKQIKLLEG